MPSSGITSQDKEQMGVVTDLAASAHVRLWQILLQKDFWPPGQQY
jgi:hypothetical protein